MAKLRIPNRDARRLLLAATGLSATPTGKLDLDSIIKGLGFVQLDAIRVVARAHHHIIWSRNQNYREQMLDAHMRKHRLVFEHFTHDASIIPMQFYPMWTRQFRRLEEKVRRWGWYEVSSIADNRLSVMESIREQGPLSTRAFNNRIGRERKMWERSPYKRALEYLWYAGDLSTAYRENFVKYYDLTERVIPGEIRAESIPDREQVHWLCDAALPRLAFGTAGDIQRFWDAVDGTEVKAWIAANPDRLAQVEVEGADGRWWPAFAPFDIEARLSAAPAATSRLRILSPFDPVIRDRKRLERLFGFEYRIEIFVPAAKRRWGYFVYPILEGDRFVGRIEVRADRKRGHMDVMNLWPEPTAKWTDRRLARLEAELSRLARFAGVERAVWSCRPFAG